MRKMYDSVTSADIPDDCDLVGGYIDGQFAWSQADWQRHAGKVQVHISVNPANNAGSVQDVEQGNGTPEQAVQWAKMRRANGADPTIYCSWATWDTVIKAFQAAGEPLPHFWIARWDGDQSIPDGAVAKQYADPNGTGGHYDASVVADHWPGVDGMPTPTPTPTPQPAPLPAPKHTALYTVVPGDTLSGIAGRYGLTWQGLWHFGNNLSRISNPNLIFAGQQIEVPAQGSVPIPLQSQYRVQPGDTLSGIAQRFHMNWTQLWDYGSNRSKVPNPNLIFPGQILDVP